MSSKNSTPSGASGSASSGPANKRGSTAPASSLELYDTVINPETTDEVTENLGTGFYTEDEQWQQIESFKKGMYGDAAFGRRLAERAVDETILGLGRNGWEWYDERDNKYAKKEGFDPENCKPRESPRERIRERGEKIWKLLGLKGENDDGMDEQLKAMIEYAGVTGDWTPPHWRMMEARHEASKSRDARTQDNVFGSRSESKKEVKHKGDGKRRGFLGRGRRGEA